MLNYKRILVSERIDVNKTSESEKFGICHYWYSLNNGSKFHPDVCNGCHDMLMMSMNLSDITILNIKGVDYRCNVSGIGKNLTQCKMKNTNLTKKSGTL